MVHSLKKDSDISCRLYEENGYVYCIEGRFNAIVPSYAPKFQKLLLRCDEEKKGELFWGTEIGYFPSKIIETNENFDTVILPKFTKGGLININRIIPLVLPRVYFDDDDVDETIRVSLLLGYLAHPEFYGGGMARLYHRYSINQKHKILPYVYRIDRPDMLAYYAERNCINSRNFEKTFLNPAIEVGAIKCIEYLKQFKQDFLTMSPSDEETICEENGITYAVKISTKADTFLHQKRLLKCDENVAGDVFIPFNVINIEKDAFVGCRNITSIIAPNFYTKNFDYTFDADTTIPLAFPLISFKKIQNDNIKTSLLLGYLAHREYYDDEVTNGFVDNSLGEDYKEYVIRQKNKLLPYIFKFDFSKMIEFYALFGRITSTNLDETFLKPAKAANATKCIEFLTKWKTENL